MIFFHVFRKLVLLKEYFSSKILHHVSAWGFVKFSCRTLAELPWNKVPLMTAVPLC